MIEAINLGKKFGEKWAIKDLNLKIARGEFFCFLGPNGAGKTTTIKIFTGLIKPTLGRIRIAGLNWHDNSIEIKKIIGYIPDTPFLYEELTLEEFLEFIIQVYKLPPKQTHSKIEFLLERFRLKEYRDVLIKEFSHGLKQRVVYISNLIHNPLYLFIDEPLVGLDPYSIRVIKDILKELTTQGTTIFMSTHILSIAQELATSIGIVDKGRMIAQGRLEELLKIKGRTLEEVFFALTEE